MAPTPETTCTACGKPVDPAAKACPACGAMLGAPDSGFSLDDDLAPPKPKPAPPPPAPDRAPDPAPAPAPAPAPEPELEWEDEGGAAEEEPVEEPAPERPAEPPRGETVRMSLADATQAWLEDAPTTTAVMDEVVDDLGPPPRSRTALLVGLAMAVVALAALAYFLL